MFETSQDFLNLVIGLCLVLFTVFVCSAMWYMIAMLRDASQMFRSFKNKLDTLDHILKLVREKLEKGSNHLALISDTVLKVAGFVMDKRSKSTRKRK